MIYFYSKIPEWVACIFGSPSVEKASSELSKKDININNRAVIHEFRNLRVRMAYLSPLVIDHLKDAGHDDRLETSKLYAHIYDAIAYQFFDFTDYVQTDHQGLMSFRFKGFALDAFKAELLHLECTYSPLASPSIH